MKCLSIVLAYCQVSGILTLCPLFIKQFDSPLFLLFFFFFFFMFYPYILYRRLPANIHRVFVLSSYRAHRNVFRNIYIFVYFPKICECGKLLWNVFTFLIFFNKENLKKQKVLLTFYSENQFEKKKTIKNTVPLN